MATFFENSENLFFFSTDHCQKLPTTFEDFVPTTVNIRSIEEQRYFLIASGLKEIKNPCKRFQPPEETELMPLINETRYENLIGMFNEHKITETVILRIVSCLGKDSLNYSTTKLLAVIAKLQKDVIRNLRTELNK